MSSDVRTAVDPARLAAADAGHPGRVRRPAPTPVSEDSRLAVEIRGLVERGAMDEARERFGALVAAHQRRASRIAFQYLRDAAEADEAVQDAFVKVFEHIASYKEAWPFEVWFTRILINGCLDRRKARARRERWFVPADEAGPLDEMRASVGLAHDANPEARLLARERRARMAAAIDRLERPAAHGVHAVPLRRLHAAGGQRDDGLERVDRAGSPVPGRAQAARPAGRPVMALAHHLHDERLLDCYFAERGGDAVDPPLAEHLADCGACGARYAELVQFMEELREDAEARERRRLHGRPAPRPAAEDPAPARARRALGAGHQLPGRARSAAASPRARRGSRRAGSPRPPRQGCSSARPRACSSTSTRADRQVTQLASARASRPSPHAARLAAADAPAAPSSEAADEAFLSELETALDRPQTRELKPFDALTPHVGLVTNTIR